MGNRRYTLELKIKFLDAFEKLGSIAAAAREVGLPIVDSCNYWLKHKEALRKDHELALKPVEPTESIRREPLRIPLEEKIRCIRAIEAGLSVHQASVEFNRSLSTVQSWYKCKDGLLVLYYSQQDPSTAEDDSTRSSMALETAWEVQMVKDQADDDLMRKCKAQAKEIEFLKDKVAFLENLNAILKERTGPGKKKTFSPQSNEASGQGEET
jgi:hypothetical protein